MTGKGLPKRAWAGAVLGAVALGLGGCLATTPEVTRGAAVFDANCAGCHGAGARGNGPLAARLALAPPDLTGLAAANGGVFPRDRVFETIYGYPGKFHSSVMPEFGAALAGPMVPVQAQDGRTVDTPRALVDLVAWLTAQQSK